MSGAESQILSWTLHLLVLFVAPIFAIGVINRTKAIWGGRKGPKLHQLFFDLLRLLRKDAVLSETASGIFQFAPWLILASGILAGLISPLVPGFAPISFPCDFVFCAYLLGLGRFFLILSALDTGSAFEGMGASREAAYAALIEPALFLSVGTLALLSGQTSLHELVSSGAEGNAAIAARLGVVLALFVLLQIEAARVPVDDPNTHLELTMIHEVMVLDHSGPELSAVQYAAAMKLVIVAGLIAAILNPVSVHENPVLSWGISILLLFGVAVLVGLVESLIARLRMRTLPAYAGAGFLLGVFSLGFALLAKGVS